MRTNSVCLMTVFALALLPSPGAESQSGGRGQARNQETTAVTVRVGGRTPGVQPRRVAAVAASDVDRRAAERHRQRAARRAHVERRELRDVVLAVDPTYCGRANSQSRLRVRSQDGWTVFITWTEVCGVPSGGEALYHVKGCNECHGVADEGAPADALRAGPALKARQLDFTAALARLRAGRAQHSYIDPYAPSQLADAELAILDWLGGQGAPAGSYVVPENRRVTLLAFEEDGQPMTGKDGLIQMVVGMDDFVNRFSHWVSEIEVQ